MRRKDREMSREFALAVMDKCEWTVVSFVTPEGEPRERGQKDRLHPSFSCRTRCVRRGRGEGEGQVHHGI